MSVVITSLFLYETIGTNLACERRYKLELLNLQLPYLRRPVHQGVPVHALPSSRLHNFPYCQRNRKKKHSRITCNPHAAFPPQANLPNHPREFRFAFHPLITCRIAHHTTLVKRTRGTVSASSPTQKYTKSKPPRHATVHLNPHGHTLSPQHQSLNTCVLRIIHCPHWFDSKMVGSLASPSLMSDEVCLTWRYM